MRTDNERESSNIEDRRGQGGFPGGKGGLSLGMVVLALAASYFFGVDPRVIMQLGSQMQSAPATAQSGPVSESDSEKAARHLVSVVLADTEDTWSAVFTEHGWQYRDPVLVLFRNATPTSCGTGQTAMGPFYCAADEKVYIDLGFYDELKNRFHAPGDFAQAYVIAHEVGHHVQHLLGISDKVQQEQRADASQANALSVRLELQADCFAGVWGNRANRSRQILDAGDIEEALTAASAIGDDTLQKQARGYAVPDSFTHGTSAQRVRWFKRGMDSGDIANCDTFSASSL